MLMGLEVAPELDLDLDLILSPYSSTFLCTQEDEEEKIGWRLESEVTAVREAAEAQLRQMQVSLHPASPSCPACFLLP